MNALLAERKGWRVDAIDVDDVAVGLSLRLKDEYRIENLRVFNADIHCYDGPCRYDILIAIDVLEHIEDDVGAVKRFSELVRPGGLVCVTVPAMPFLYGYHDEMLGHYRRYDKRGLTALLTPLLTLCKCRYFGGSLVPVALTCSRLLRKPYQVMGGGGISRPLLRMALNGILGLESKVSLPFGTSLMALAMAGRKGEP